MYRIFCESYENFLKQYDGLFQCDDYRYSIIKPFELIRNTERFRLEQTQETLLYKQLSDLLFYMADNLERFPKMGAFLWTLEARGIKGQHYGVVQEVELEEQIKMANMFLNLLYWDKAEH
jgi:hypothetical protein